MTRHDEPAEGDVAGVAEAAPCSGHGGVVYTYQGPQFGPQIIEEPCEVCGGWHKRATERAQ